MFVHKVGSPFRFAGGFIAGPNIAFNPDVIYSDWTRSFTTTPLNYDPTAANQFLRTTGNVISVGVENFFTSPPLKQSLDFSAFTSGGVSLGLSADDGLAYFQGEVQAGNTYAYAGIYETTDLGAPITDSSFSAAWDGKYDINGGAGRGDFTLNVTFAGTSGTINAFIIDANSTSDFLIEGTFDENGVITGKTHFAMFDNDVSTAITDRDGILSGLIGQEGAVGVIYGTGFNIGGFVASPVVTICAKDVFDALCPVNTDVSVQTAFCLNTVANEGKNPFHAMCDTDGTTHGDVNGARDATCFARGDMADTRCANRANVLTACDMDAYRQTTGLGVSNTNLCTGMSTTYTDTYSNLRLECEKSDVGSFAEYCDSQDAIGDVQTARNTYCGAKLTDLSEATNNCVSRLDAICITNPTAPFAGICGTGITAGQIMACSGTIRDLTTKGAMAGDCNDDDLSGAICGDTNSMGGSNPFAEICSNMDAIRTGFMKDKAQLEACKGALNALPANNSCASRGLSGMICGNDASESGSNPFAPICESPTQNENYLNRVASRQISCGNDRLGALDANKGNCDTLQDGLCDTAVKSLSATMRGEGNFVCSTDDGPTVVLLRNNYCEDPATTYNDVVGCRNAEGNNDGEVRKVRKQLGVDCVKGNTKNDASLHADCQKTVNGAITVEDCSANPYRNECIAGELLNEFADVTTARNALCTTSVSNSDPFHALCNVYPMINTQRVDYCDEDTTAWEGRCLGGSLVDTGNAIANARANVCIDNKAIITTAGSETVAAGSSLFNILCNGLMDRTTAKTVMTARDTACTEQGADGAGANNDCVNRANVRLLCDVDPFTKPTVNVSAELCTGTNPNGHNNNPELDSAARTRICETPETTFDPGCGTENKYGSNTNTVRNQVCRANPFDTNCAGDYLVEDTDKLAFCRDGVRNPAGKAGGCAIGTQLVIDACGRNPGDPVCADDDATKVTAGDWTRAQPALLNTAPGPKNQFLAIADNEISTDGTSNALGNGNPTVYKLDFSDFIHNGASVVGLDAADGLAYFGGMKSGSRFEYAGIYGTTDLGAPIAESGFSATWAGKLQVDTFSMVDFDLTVAFDGADGTLTGVRQNFTGLRDFIIDGKFDAKGVITGKVHNQLLLQEITLAHSLRNGTLSGLIGQDGAVGVFYDVAGISYVGGFVAVPTTIGPIATACAGDSGDPICPDDDVTKVTASDWERVRESALNTDPTAENQFLKIADDTISTGDAKKINDNTLPAEVFKVDFSDFSYGGASLNLPDNNGFAYFRGKIDTVAYFYAGIFGTTDLGEPITNDIVSATWAARAGFTIAFHPEVDFTLDVTFDGTTGTGTVKAFLVDGLGVNDFIIDGRFDASGVITGDTHLMEFNNDMQTSISNPNGILSGIIGSDGAVGVFHGTSGYSGGFVAIPTATGLIATACGTDSGDPICPDDDVAKVTAKDWQRGQPAPLRTYPTAEDQFLKIAGNQISTEETTRGASSTSGPPIPRPLDFSAFTYGGASLGLSDDDGVAYFQGYIGNTFYEYAGIFGSTDLGAPITTSGFSATWAAKLHFTNVAVKDFNLTVTFNGTTATGTVDGFLVDIVSTFDLLIDGEFDANGVISGKVHYADFTNNLPTATADRNGTLSGIIGAEGAVGAFYKQTGTSYVGGFVASAEATRLTDICETNVFDVACPVREEPAAIRAFCADTNYINPLCPTVQAKDWVDSFTNPALNVDSSDLAVKRQFVQIPGKTLSAEGVTRDTRLNSGIAPVHTLDFGSMGLDDDDGLTWVRGSRHHTNSPVSYAYVAIYGTTDLGAPITESGFSATWPAKLQVGGLSAVDFDLTVTFDGRAGTGTLYAFLVNFSNSFDFLIDGEFDENGLITGDAHFAQFNGNVPTGTADRHGALSGIIGRDGVVGVFLSRESTVSERIPNSFDGGFVAAPDTVNTGDWLSSFTSPALRTTLTAGSKFLQLSGTTINTVGTLTRASGNGVTPTATTLDFTAFSFDIASGLDDNDGVAHFFGWIDGSGLYSYAGIYESTNLGAPITESGFSATWAGKLQVTRNSKDFDLKVTFGGTDGTVKAFLENISGFSDFSIDGRFGVNGVITGKVHFASATHPTSPDGFNGTLSGIIGSDGAVGVFHATGSFAYEGGFLAVPPPVVNADDWVSSFATLSTTPTAGNQFLKIAGKTINRSGTTRNSNGLGGDPVVRPLDFSAFSSGTIPLGLDANDGLAYFEGFFGSTYSHYAGIYASTDLGAPITESGMNATWVGKLRYGVAVEENFTLAVTFDGSTGTVKAFLENILGTIDFSINGRFGANGVITGGVHFASATHPTSPNSFNGTLSGIIGQDGAVGVFHSAAVGGYSGGFIAVPDTVNAGDWVSSFTSPSLTPTPTTGNKFLQIAGTTLSTSGTTRNSNGEGGDPVVRPLNFSEFSSGTIPLGLDANDGLAYFRGWIGDKRSSYAGIYASTDLGAPITESGMNATWPAKLGFNAFVIDFNLAVTFDGTTGTVEADIQNVNSDAIISRGIDFSINGRFDANGLITGKVHYDAATHPESPADFEGTLSGIIGSGGAVGVFVLDSGSNAGTNGGFIAAPAR